MLTVWGRVNSVNVKKALWVIEELGLQYERIDAGLQFGVNKTPEYLAMNPTALVPTIRDGDFVLWESHTIVRYLAAKHAMGTLCPSELRARADAERWMDWAFTLQGAVRNAFWGLIRTPPEKRDPKAVEESRQKSAELLAIPEKALAKKPFICGDRLTMGDIPLGCEFQRWYRLPGERPAFPNLEAWFERLRERPAFRKTVDLPLS
ncbi:MAG TPA: glutathione S-transferase [Burkholderiales bacterium]|nr:glutathione S-transferase [Burkholderiales bacterium]